MKVSHARKVLKKSGINWSNYFDLCDLLDTTLSGVLFKEEKQAAQRLVYFLTRGF